MKKPICLRLAFMMLVLPFLFFSCKKDEVVLNPVVYQAPLDDIFTATDLMGVNYGPYHYDGQAPGTPIPVSQIRTDMALIANNFNFIRTYTVEDGMEQVIPEAAAKNIQVAVGIYCNPSDAARTRANIDLAVNTTKLNPQAVSALVIGNETDLTGPDDATVAGHMDYAKSKLTEAGITDITVTSCLTGGGVASCPQILGKCKTLNTQGNKIIMLTIYPFYGQKDQGQNHPEDIAANMRWSYDNCIKPAMDNGLTVVIGEIGWPSGGNTTAMENVGNMRVNYGVTLSWIKGNNDQKIQYNTLWFAMFDEPWKVTEPDGIGPHWGFYEKNGSTSPKFPIIR